MKYKTPNSTVLSTPSLQRWKLTTDHFKDLSVGVVLSSFLSYFLYCSVLVEVSKLTMPKETILFQ